MNVEICAWSCGQNTGIPKLTAFRLPLPLTIQIRGNAILYNESAECLFDMYLGSFFLIECNCSNRFSLYFPDLYKYDYDPNHNI